MTIIDHYGPRWVVFVQLEWNWPGVRVKRDRTHTELDLALPFVWILVSRRREP